MGNKLYLRKEKQVRELRRIDFDVDKYQYTNTIGMGLSLEFSESNSRIFSDAKIGHIEVSVMELRTEHFSERLEEFIVRAAALYDEVILGNPKPGETEIVKVE